MKNKAIIFILMLGLTYKLVSTWDGSFIFHMDSARDMVEVRDMVVLKNPRLVGPNTAIDGLFSGPAWYYILAIPFVISGGDPYAPVIMQFILWFVGGVFLLKVVSIWNKWLIVPTAAIWIASNYLTLATLYSFNPTPVTLLTPVFIFLLHKYLETNKLVYSISTFFLGGVFFNLEMNFAVFIPSIIFLSILFSKKIRLIKSRSFLLGILAFLICLLPQVLFDIRNEFIMSKGILSQIQRDSKPFNFISQIHSQSENFYNVFVPTLFNKKLLAILLIVLLVPVFIMFLKDRKRNNIVLISLLYIFVPFLGYLFLPVAVNPWHLGPPMAAAIFIVAFILHQLFRLNVIGKLLSFCLSASIVSFGILNVANYFISDRVKPNMNPSLYKNEIAAIDYVYQYAGGKNFKVYSYLPSIYDYPYQYLIWWYGLRKFGYLPAEYAYLPNVFQYIPNKDKFSASIEDLQKRQNSNLIFLIKEPNHKFTLFGWEGNFAKLETIEKKKIGPLEIEIKKEL